MPRIKLPIQPSTWACPCAWIHAGEMLSAARRPLMEMRFHTPEERPGQEHEQQAARYEEDQQTRELQFAGAGAFEDLEGRFRFGAGHER